MNTRPSRVIHHEPRRAINPETLRNWVVQAEVDEGYRPGTTTSESQRLIELEKEVRELRRANSILRSASAFFAAEGPVNLSV